MRLSYREKLTGLRNKCCLTALILSLQAHAQCPAERQYVPLNIKGSFSYVRYEPQGNYLLYTDVQASASKVIKLNRGPGNKITAGEPIRTNFGTEPYAAEGMKDGKRVWRYVVSGSGHYYDFEKFLTMQDRSDARKLESAFYDSEHKEFYHSCGMVSETPYKIRTMVWTDLKTRDYQITEAKDGSIAVQKSEVQSVCAKIYTLNEANEKVFYERSEINPKNPIISRDGRFISVRILDKDSPYKSSQPNHILEIKANGECLLIGNLGYTANKPQFGFTKGTDKPKIVARIETGYAGRFSGGIVLVDFNSNPRSEYRIDQNEDGLVTDPGFTEDGKILYVRRTFTANASNELVIVDEKKEIECQKMLNAANSTTSGGASTPEKATK